MELIFNCPLGKKCEEIKSNRVHRCRWYVQLKGKHPQSEEIIDEWNCALSWLPILMIENAQTNRGQTQALESFRNETIRRQDRFNAILNNAANRKRIKCE